MVVVDPAETVVEDSASVVDVVAIVVSEAIVDELAVRLVSAVVVVDSAWTVVEVSARVVLEVEYSEVAVESDAIVDELAARLVTPVVLTLEVLGRQGPGLASTPSRDRVTAKAVRREKRTILARIENKNVQTSGRHCGQ